MCRTRTSVSPCGCRLTVLTACRYKCFQSKYPELEIGVEYSDRDSPSPDLCDSMDSDRSARSRRRRSQYVIKAEACEECSDESDNIRFRRRRNTEDFEVVQSERMEDGKGQTGVFGKVLRNMGKFKFGGWKV